MGCMERRYMNDFFNYHLVEQATQVCLDGIGLQYETLASCYNGNAGDEAVRNEAKATFDHDGVPVMYVNDKIVNPPNCQHSVLFGSICDELPARKPDVCNAPAYPCRSDLSVGCKASLVV